MVLFHASPSGLGVGSFAPNDKATSDQDPIVFRSEDPFWRDIGEVFAGAGIGVNLFLFPASSINVAGIGFSLLLDNGSSTLITTFGRQCGSSNWWRHLLSS